MSPPIKTEENVSDTVMVVPSQGIDEFLQYCKEHQTPTQPTHTFGPNLYLIHDIPPKGRGLIAGVNIPKGQRILLEQPLFTSSLEWTSYQDFESHLSHTITTLPPAAHDTFFALHNANPTSEHPLTARFLTNCLPDQDRSTASVYSTACLINHDCRANAHGEWNTDAKAATIHAVRDINAGEEITMNYVSGKVKEVRDDKLNRLFNISCTCELCCLPPLAIQESDARRTEIYMLFEEIGIAHNILNEPEQCLEECGRLMDLIDEEFAGYSEHLLLSAQACEAAFHVCATHSDLASACALQRRSYEMRVVFAGSDAPLVKQMRSAMEYQHRETAADAWRKCSRWHTRRGDEPKLLKFMGEH
ncbi:MAG: hypothetical protein Q9184_004221 [Pyrenodesmia sp. 2 TL-2023]